MNAKFVSLGRLMQILFIRPDKRPKKKQTLQVIKDNIILLITRV